MPCYWCPRAGARAVHWRCLSYVSFLLCSSCRPPFSGFRAQLTRRLDSGLLEFRAAAQSAQTTVRFAQSTHRKRTTHSGWPPDGFGNAGRPPAATLTASRRRVIFSASRFVQPGERCSFPTTDVSSQDECGLPMAAQRIAAGGETENRRRESKHPLERCTQGGPTQLAALALLGPIPSEERCVIGSYNRNVCASYAPTLARRDDN